MNLLRALACLTCLAAAGWLHADDASVLRSLGMQIDRGYISQALESAEELREKIDEETATDPRARAERYDALMHLLYDRAHVAGPVAIDAWVDTAAKATRIADWLGEDHPRTLIARARYALMLAERRQLDQAHEQLGRIKQHVRSDTSPLIRARVAIIEAAVAMAERDPLAETLIKSAIEQLDVPEAFDDIALTRAQRHLQTYLARQGRAHDSLATVDAYLARAEQHFGPDHLGLAYPLQNACFAHMTAERFEVSAGHARRLIDLYTKHLGPDTPHLIMATHMLVASLLDDGRDDEVIEITNATFSRYAEVPVGHGYTLAKLYNNAASANHRAGNFARAVAQRRQAVALLESLDNMFAKVLLATSLRYLGADLIALGDTDKARPALWRGLELQERFHGPSHQEVLKGHVYLGQLAFETGDFDAARTHFDEVIRRVGPLETGTFTPDLTQAWLGRAALLDRVGQTKQAVEIVERVVAYYERRLGPDNPRVHVSLIELGRMQSRAGDHEAAAVIAQRVLRERKARGLVRSRIYRQALELHAEALYGAGKLAKALDAAAAASRMLDASVRDIAAALPEKRIEGILALIDAPERFVFAALSEKSVRARAHREAWAWTLRRRGVMLEELALRQRAAAISQTPNEVALWKELNDTRRELATLWVSGPGADPATFEERLSAALEARERAEQAAIDNHRQLGRRLRGQRVDLDDVLAALPARTALVEIVRAPGVGQEGSEDFALIVTPDKRLASAPLGPATQIDALVQRWRAELDAAVRARRPAELAQALKTGRLLRARVWDPLLEHIAGAEHVLFVPDGSLNLLHPGSLPLDDSTFMMESGPSVHLLSSAREVVTGPSTDERQGHGLLALGAPDYGAPTQARLAALEGVSRKHLYRGIDYGCFGLKQVDWPDLPGSRAEIENVAELYRDREPVDIRTASAASEELLRAALPGKRIAHIATHGFFVPRDECQVENDSALLRSGLILAGARRRDALAEQADDGVLTAEELATLDLTGVELVVLSACDTGRGDVTVGEGVLGLRRALEIAGARSVVMSLTSVSDVWTERWMRTFYQSLLDGHSTRTAARAASLASLQGLRARGLAPHPSLWAAFISSGDWR